MQSNLGFIYFYGEKIPCDIKKSIYYLTLAENNNNVDSQYQLFVINYSNEYIPMNINKAIYYLTLAANNNHAFFMLKAKMFHLMLTKEFII